MIDLPYLSPEKLLFSTLDNETLKEISVKCLTNPTSLDRIGTPLAGGLYDPALGPSERNEVCQTCKQFSTNCPGHFGHIQLPLPVFNPIYFSYLVAVLRTCCFACYRIVCKDYESHVLSLQIAAIRTGNISCSESLSELANAISSRANGEVDVERKRSKKVVLEDDAHEEIIKDIKYQTNDLFNSVVKHSNNQIESTPSTTEYLLNILTTLMKTLAGRKQCNHCGAPIRDVITEGNTKIYLKPLSNKKLEIWDTAFKKQTITEVNSNSPWHRVNQTVLLTPNVAMAFLKKVYNRDTGVCKMLLNGTNPSTMFYSIICVPPVKFRPISVVNGRKYDNIISNKLSGIISSAIQLSTLLQEQKTVSLDKSVSDTTDQVEKYKEIQAVWLKIQTDVNQFVGMVKGQLEKKQGLFRMHMMGKRVNYAARSVISPDPNINCDEIGIPLVFATRLTYPQPVTPWNVIELRRAVINGPLKYPGATHVEMEDGKRVILRADNKSQRESIAKQLLVEDHKRIGYNKKVCRHVKDGDILLLNRQPTLHRVSIMAHRARVLSNEKTLRLHYSVCKSYNADFDGDEMNAHLLQDELSRSEAYNLMSVNDQFLAPKDGKPLGGLIQDHTVAATLLTQRGRFFTKAEYVEFVYQGLGDCPRRIAIEPPAILKPRKMWSGKQIITTLIKTIVPPNRKFLSLSGKCTTPEKCWVNTDHINHNVDVSGLADSQVIIQNGELLSGVVDKSQCGSKDFGLVHCVFELYGGEVATQLLSAFGRLFTAFLHWRGFTLGIEDVTVQLHGEEERREILKFCSGKGDEIACKVLNVDTPSDLSAAYQQAHLNPLPFKDLSALDRAMRPETGKIETEVSRECMGINLWKSFPANNLQLMVRSGAKGSEVNCVQISCMVGQVELEGARPPLMLSGRTLPSYLPYDPSLSAGGFITSRFATGIKPQEMFFNCMAGREGLVDTAVKTSRSGYLQRCLIKHLEGICTSYDHTVRDSDGGIIQFLYGYDGIDITKANFLCPTGLKHLKSNAKILPSLSRNEKRFLNFISAPEYVKNSKQNKLESRKKVSGFLAYEKKMRKKESFSSISNVRTDFRSSQDLAILESWAVMDRKKRRKWEQKSGMKKYLPVLSTFSPHRYYGSVSEKLYNDVRKVLADNTAKHDIEQTILMHALRGLSHPGDGVGVLAGQSIGEPSTQMTLNTFHFAGRADMNITMGIPRLRELLMTSGASMKTPMSQFPLKLGTLHTEAKNLAKMLSEVRLSQVLEKVDIVESIVHQGGGLIKRYKIKFHLLPEEYYSDKCYCTSKKVLEFMETTFIPHLSTEFVKRGRIQTSLAVVKEDDTPPTIKVSKEEEFENDEREEKANIQIADYDDESEEETPEDVTILSQPKVEPEDAEAIETKLDERQLAILKKKSVVSYNYDKENFSWCEVTFDFVLTGANVMMSSVIRELAEKALVWNISGIKRAFVNNDRDDKGRWVVITDGINILELWKHHHVVDINDIYTNDINMFCEFYGVEAAMEALVKEISGVFGAYGIKVDNRHLSLVGDYVTHYGQYRPFNRIGIKHSSSLLQKVTFETSMEFLRRAAVFNETDTLYGPSSCIVMGKLGNYGTGACEIRHPLM